MKWTNPYFYTELTYTAKKYWWCLVMCIAYQMHDAHINFVNKILYINYKFVDP